MKNLTLFVLFLALTLACASSKSKNDQMPEKTPEAEVSLAPGYIQTLLEITNISEAENEKTITAVVKEVMNYGSATDPVPAGTEIQFIMKDSFSKDVINKVKSGETITTILSKQGSEMMMGDQKKNLWKLISIQ